MTATPQIATALHWAVTQLPHSPTAKLDAEVLLSHVLGVDRVYLLTWPERLLTNSEWQTMQALVAQRANGIPVAYLIGQREFWSLPLQVNNSTLIPRPDTEVLVETALQLSLPPAARVLDLGTGTGAIALALKSSQPQWQVTAVDRERAAVTLAQHNANSLKLAVAVIQSDWFAALPEQQFDLIVSNPPYIDGDDPHLQQGDVRFEPTTALVAAQQGLADLFHIIDTAPLFLAPAGWLVLEHGWQQGAAVRSQLTRQGYQQVTTVCDYANLERVTIGQWSRHYVE